MVRLAQRVFALLLLTSPLLVGCGDSSKSSRDANTSDTVTVPDTGAKPDLVGDTVVVVPDAKTTDVGTAPDTSPNKPDVATDTPATTGDTGPVASKDAPVDGAGDVAGDGSAAEAGSADAGATD